MRPRNVSHPVFTLKSISFTSFLEQANYTRLIHIHHCGNVAPPNIWLQPQKPQSYTTIHLCGTRESLFYTVDLFIVLTNRVLKSIILKH